MEPTLVFSTNHISRFRKEKQARISRLGHKNLRLRATRTLLRLGWVVVDYISSTKRKTALRELNWTAFSSVLVFCWIKRNLSRGRMKLALTRENSLREFLSIKLFVFRLNFSWDKTELLLSICWDTTESLLSHFWITAESLLSQCWVIDESMLSN